ncbi:MAG: hypothetical protein PVG32_20220 [Anaerolineales bacterium]
MNTRKPSIAFIPGYPAIIPKPLARFTPPLNDGIANHWLRDQLPQGSWVLDPFGSAPQLAIETAQSDYRILVSAHNPILRFILEILANPPTKSDLEAALATLAASRRGDERMETHIKSLYATVCHRCEQNITADAFLWERDASAPITRIYRCNNCEAEGEFPTTESDAYRASQFTSKGLHRARALERVTPINDPDRSHVEEALAVYPPRAIYAIVSLINKLDGLAIKEQERRYLYALLISAFDRTNTLWPHPSGRDRPKQLTVPPLYRENNIWTALEQSVKDWAADYPPINLTIWPDPLETTSGIIVLEGRFKDFRESLKQINIQGILTALPRPNQAFWTLSALWAGWLWGHESVAPYKSVLRRRRYDWNWHANALTAAFNNLVPTLSPGTPILGIIGEAEPGFTAAGLISAKLSDLSLEDVALRSKLNVAQVFWKLKTNKISASQEKSTDIITSITQAARGYLLERGEPGTFLQVHSAALKKLVEKEAIFDKQKLSSGETLSQIQSTFQQALSYNLGFYRYGGTDKSLEVGQWWLRNDKNRNQPLADRIEQELVDYLLRHQSVDLYELDRYLCNIFPGLLTPNPELLQVILESYAVQESQNITSWRINPQDVPASRRNDLREMSAILDNLGERLGFSVTENQTRIEGVESYIWEDIGEDPVNNILFFISASALLGKFTHPEHILPKRTWIILPGSRANIVAYKLQKNPHLANIINQTCGFIKYRHLRRLSQGDQITPDNLATQFDLDPLTYSEIQMRML